MTSSKSTASHTSPDQSEGGDLELSDAQLEKMKQHALAEGTTPQALLDGFIDDLPVEEVVRMNIDMPKSLHRQVKTHAISHGTYIKVVVIKALREYLDKYAE